PMRRDHDHDRTGEQLLELSEEGQPISIWKPSVEDDQLRRSLLRRAPRLVKRAGQRHGKPFALERRRRHRGERPIVIDQQGGEHHAWRSSLNRTVKRLPAAVRSKSSWPPW